ncbi:MAG: translation initiation factor IF-3 [Thermodesulfovibrionales bacterium]|nr:translation initiation factor IF-3 [Thermodesulfovibrionales bacterium]
MRRYSTGGESISKDTRINEQIRVREVRLVDSDGKQLGVLPIQEALKTAAARDLDLVEVAPGAAPPVCRIMDFGKYKYQLSKRHTAKKTGGLKEVKIRPQIDDHDLELKVRNIKRFIDEGNKAKVTMFFRGRERGRPELGMKVFDRLVSLLTGKFTIEHAPRHEGNSITMVIAPK